MPVVRQVPLRQRRKVNLEVYTAFPPGFDDEPYEVQRNFLKGRLERNLQRRGPTVSQRTIHPRTPTYEPIVPSSSRTPSPPPLDFEDFHVLIPDLSLAYSEGDYTPSSAAQFRRPLQTNPFTHFVKILASTPDRPAGSIYPEDDEDSGARTLLLYIDLPPPCMRPRHHQRHVRDYTLLSDAQLLAARDFMCLALPYLVMAQQDGKNVQLRDKVHVLVTAPRANGTAADVVSIVACYLGFASGEPVGYVLDAVDESVLMHHEYSAWTGALGEDGLRILESIERDAELC